MSPTYVRLADSAIFKSRYEQRYLINTSCRNRERILIEGGAEQVLLFLFSGKSISGACTHFCLDSEQLTAYIQGLVAENVVAWCTSAIDSTAKCYNTEPPLDSINILLTNAFNLDCVHCWLSCGKPIVGELTCDVLISVLHEAEQLGVFEVNVSGGEPTLHRNFIQIAKHISSIPCFNANLNTNGVSLPPQYIETIAQAFTSVQISIDDVVASKHDKFRGRRGSFKRSIETIRQLVNTGVETNIGFTLTADNITALDDIVELAENLGVTVLNIGLVANLGRAHDNLLLKEFGTGPCHNSPFMDQVYQRIKKLSVSSSNVQILLPFRIPDKNRPAPLQDKRYICDGDNTQVLYITANGNMMPCDKLPVEAFSYGNVRQNTILGTWQSDRMKKFKLMSPNELPKCKKCPDLRLCGGACVARAYQEGGSLDSSDWISCVIAQKVSQDY